MKTTLFLILLSIFTYAQQMNIHTQSGTDVYKLAEIDSITFVVASSGETGTMTDIDGNVYQTVKIGDQWWMAENLKVTHYRNGDSISNVTDNTAWINLVTGAWGAYNNDNENVATYGLLYNWYAVDDSRNIAPEGWHVPSDEEWKKLEMYLGMSQSEAEQTGYRGAPVGGKLKETGLINWLNPNSGATDEVGFSAKPSGYRYGNTGKFNSLGELAYYWSSTESSSSWSYGRRLKYDTDSIDHDEYKKHDGGAIRCVKD